MAFNIPLILTGVGAGFIVGGPVGAVVGGGAAAAASHKPDVTVVQTPTGPVAVTKDASGAPVAVNTNAGFPTGVTVDSSGVHVTIPDTGIPFIPPSYNMPGLTLNGFGDTTSSPLKTVAVGAALIAAVWYFMGRGFKFG